MFGPSSSLYPQTAKKVVEDLDDGEVMGKIVQHLASLVSLVPKDLGSWSDALVEIKKVVSERLSLESALSELNENVVSLAAREQSLVREISAAKAYAEDERNKVEAYAKDLYEQRHKVGQERNSLVEEKRKLDAEHEKLEGERQKLMDGKLASDATMTNLQAHVMSFFLRNDYYLSKVFPTLFRISCIVASLIRSLGKFIREPLPMVITTTYLLSLRHAKPTVLLRNFLLIDPMLQHTFWPL